MSKRWAALPRGIRWLIGGIAAVVLALVVTWVLFVPAADWLARHDVGSAHGMLLQMARDDARGRLLTLGAGLFAAGALWFTAQSFTLSREGQVTDRYTAAITQLGSKKLDVRIGGIYALERVARDSARDHPTVMEVLSAFVREHSHDPRPDGGEPPADAPERLAGLVARPSERPTPRPVARPDVQAAVTVIGRRNTRRDRQRVNLSRADLTGAILRDANLARADLSDANLTLANLSRADLTGAILSDAILSGPLFTFAKLDGAYFYGAKLSAIAFGLEELARANLTGAYLPKVAAIPPGWQRDPASGRLKLADTSSGGTTTN